MSEQRPVRFVFDERSLETRDALEKQGVTFDDVVIRDPENGEERILVIPRPRKAVIDER